MLFVELRFFLFLPVVLAGYWLVLRTNRSRKVWLTLASYVFYGAWDWRFLVLIWSSTVLDYFAGRGVASTAAPGRRKLWLTASLIGNLGLLGFFKYYNFFVSSAADLLTAIGFQPHVPLLELALPVGISFYTFQTLSYTIDIYRGNLEPVDDFIDLALFVSFFPQLVAGPIVRAVQFLPQLSRVRTFAEDVDLRPAITLFWIGFVKKTCIADVVAPIADSVFLEPGLHDVAATWMGAILFSIQAYCDFSGYSDMAIGLAGMLGYQLPMNFNWPAVSRTVTEHWGRWHISMGQWFMQYVYFPLGGSRRGLGRTLRNLMVVFLLSGLWHGAAWTYVTFGFLQGVATIVERLGLKRWLDGLPRAVGMVYNNIWWVVTLVVLRAHDLDNAWHMLGRMFGLSPFEGEAGGGALSGSWWAVVAGIACVHLAFWQLKPAERSRALPDWAFAIGLGAAVALTLPWLPTGAAPFFYFQF